ncbi:MAG: 30S ribosomal protein S6 [Bacilli bacterium]|jgi:small subunit ribosomal protein S6|nr:30S ribosomal protein S6 [Bacilli bacterium]
MRNYEIMFIVRPTLGEDEVKKVIKDFGKILTDNGAKIINEKDMGQRELAYEINDFKSGFYYVYNIETNDDKAINEFDRLSLISKDIIRHLITKEEK